MNVFDSNVFASQVFASNVFRGVGAPVVAPVPVPVAAKVRIGPIHSRLFRKRLYIHQKVGICRPDDAECIRDLMPWKSGKAPTSAPSEVLPRKKEAGLLFDARKETAALREDVKKLRDRIRAATDTHKEEIRTLKIENDRLRRERLRLPPYPPFRHPAWTRVRKPEKERVPQAPPRALARVLEAPAAPEPARGLPWLAASAGSLLFTRFILPEKPEIVRTVGYLGSLGLFATGIILSLSGKEEDKTSNSS